MTLKWHLLLLTLLFKSTTQETISEIYGDELLGQLVFHESGPFGSTRGGAWFTDFWQSLNGRVIKPDHWPDTINVRSGGRIDSIQIFYGGYKGGFYGGEGGKLNKVRLYDGDRIVRVEGRSGIGPGAGVDSLTFYTLHGKTFGPFGGSGGYAFQAAPPKEGCYLAFISGRSDLRLDAITFHWRCPVTYSVQKSTFTVQTSEGTTLKSDYLAIFLLLTLRWLRP